MTRGGPSLGGSEQRPVVVGRITAPFGVRGWVKVVSFTDPPENLLDYRPWWLESEVGYEPVTVAALKPHAKGWIARFDGCGDRDTASAYAGRDLAVPRERLPRAEVDEYYWSDLIGLAVYNREGTALGRVARMMETGANDVLVVRDAGAGRERLIPFVGAAVDEVDLAGGMLHVDWDPAF